MVLPVGMRGTINLVHQRMIMTWKYSVVFSEWKKEEDFQINALLGAGEAIKSDWREGQEVRRTLRLTQIIHHKRILSQQRAGSGSSLNPSALQTPKK